ncbi:MAG: GntR family transcriptional regulator [Gammaproteobacteria bacterium]
MPSQQARVTVQLREMILNGEFAPGQHIAEISLATSLGVSRTPVRQALGILEQEGLVTGTPHRGFRVESFSMQDISDAIDVRGTLEGMAARLLAEHGLPRRTAAELHRCLELGDRIVEKGLLEEGDTADYDDMNTLFHKTITDAAGNRALNNALNLNDKVPFAAASAVAMSKQKITQQIIHLGHGQHHTIVEALEKGEGARAEALMREHALITKKALNLIDAEHGLSKHMMQGLRLA